MSCSFCKCRSLFLARTPAAIRALTSSVRFIPLFHGTFPLLAAEILAREACVCEYPPFSVGRGMSLSLSSMMSSFPSLSGDVTQNESESFDSDALSSFVAF